MSNDTIKREATQTVQKLSSVGQKQPIAGFKQFISRGSMVDMAVGVVMGSAVTAVVNSIVKNFLSPLIAMIFGKPDLSGLLTIHNRNATISFGAILGDVLNFLLVAAAIYFCVILPMNKIRDLANAISKKNDEKQDEQPNTEEQTLQILNEILVELKRPTSERSSGISSK